ncbi:MAG: ATP-binding protein [Pseudomonadota bacterium]
MTAIKSIRARMALYLLLAALLTAVVVGVVTYRKTLQENEDLFDYQLRQIALSLRDQGVVTAPELPYGVEDDALDVVVQIWTMNGVMLYLSRPGNPLFDRATLGYSEVNAINKRWRVYSMLARDRVIQVAQPLQLRRDLAAAAALRSLTPLLAFAPLMAAMIWWLTAVSLASLKRLTRELAQRDAHTLEQVSQHDVPDEILPMVDALNALLLRLKRAFASQRAFVADAAHELRSPLTALRMQLQLLERAPDEASRAQAMHELNQGVDRSTRLIGQLLAAAQTDPQDAAIGKQPVDVAESLRQVMAELFPQAQARNITLELDAADHVSIAAEPVGLSILVRNLLENAVRYTPAGGMVQAQVVAGETGVQLVVEDSGPGIAPEERERVFDRFYRGGANEPTGSGLGLSIVRNIVEQHGASITLGESRYGGLKVSVTFQAN